MLKPTNILRRLLALCLCLLLAAGSACAEKPVLLTFDTEEIPTCDLILPDGRLILSEIPTEKDVNLFCLNTDRTVSWKYSISVKDVNRIFDISPTPEYSSLYHMSVMSDGTIAVVLITEDSNGVHRHPILFLSEKGKPTKRKVLLPKDGWNLYAAKASYLVFYDFERNNSLDAPVYHTEIRDWDGNVLAAYDGLIMNGGYGYLMPDLDELTACGQDTYENSRATFMKMDGPQGNILWETKLDHQYPDTEYAVMQDFLKLKDGSYAGYLTETARKPDDDYVLKDVMVKFDAQGNVQWTDKESFGGEGCRIHGIYEYDGKIAVWYGPLWNPETLFWYDTEGNILGTTEVKISLEELKTLKPFKKAKEFPEGGIFQLIPMADGLWARASYRPANSNKKYKNIMFKVPVI